MKDYVTRGRQSSFFSEAVAHQQALESVVEERPERVGGGPVTFDVNAHPGVDPVGLLLLWATLDDFDLFRLFARTFFFDKLPPKVKPLDAEG